MITEELVRAYRRDGVVMVPDVVDQDLLAKARAALDELVAASAAVTENNNIYDLDPGHEPNQPRIRRIKSPHKVHRIFDEIVRSPRMIASLTNLIGPGLRLHGAKLNMKSAMHGAAVEWHQDWAFYPHTNDDILAVGVLLDDCTLENGPLLVTPGTHRGEIWDHHDDGSFVGMIDPKLIQDEIKRAAPCTGKAGSVSFHHVRALHGSAPNRSSRSRNLLLYEVAASDAWPLMGIDDFAEFDSRLLAGPSVITPRLSAIPVRMPLPPAKRQGSIYETQAEGKKSYFNRPEYAETD